MAARSTQHTVRLLLLSALLAAAALRWADLRLVEFKYDEAHIVGQALELARGGAAPLLSGGTTPGIARGPFDVYLLALPLKVMEGRVEAAVWLLASLGVLAVALTYVAALRVAGPRAGVLAAWLMATNPWLVFYDRKLWAHIQVVFSVALFLLAWQVIVNNRRRPAFWFPVIAALQLLAHVLALLQGLSWLAAVLIAPRRWWAARRELGGGLAVGAGLLAPYLWALGRSDSRTTVGDALQPIGRAVADAAEGAARLLAGDGLHVLAALPRHAFASWQITAILVFPLVALTGLGLIRTMIGLQDRPWGAGSRLLLAWTLAPALALLLGPLQPAQQYWTALLPLPALYLALGIEWIALAATRVAGRAIAIEGPADRPTTLTWALAVVPVLVLASVWAAGYADLLAAVRAGAGAATFGPPLGRWSETLAAARQWADRLGTQEVRVAVNGVDPGYEGEPAAVAALIGNPPFARFVAPTSPPALLLAYDRPSLYLWAVDAPETERQLTRLGEPVWSGELAAGHPRPRLYRLPPATTIHLEYTKLEPAPLFDCGLMLLGYRLPAPARGGEPLEVTLIWRVLDPPASVRTRDMTAFNHILDTQGQTAGQADGLALLSRDWWPGDVLIQPYAITLPPGTYRWRTGIYSRRDGGRAQLTTGGDSVDLPAFVVR
ncbi:MAG: ArnT family glycosyltransferase [Anaerolineae bacterium]